MTTTSVVVPVRDNAAALFELVDRLTVTLSPGPSDYEIVLVDDASGDRSWEAILDLAAADDRIHGLHFDHRIGQVRAIAAGVRASIGSHIAYLDADLEYSPEDIPRLIERLDDGADMVSGVRPATVSRPLARRAMSASLKHLGPRRLRSRITDPGSGMKAWRRPVWDAALRHPWLCQDFTVLTTLAAHAERIDNVPLSASGPHHRSSYRLLDLVGVVLAVLFLSSPRLFAITALVGAAFATSTPFVGLALALSGRPLIAAIAAAALLFFAGVLLAIGGLGVALLRVSSDHIATSMPDGATAIIAARGTC